MDDTSFLPIAWMVCIIGIIVVLFAVFFFYLYFKRRMQAVTQDSGETASLATKKEQLIADIKNMEQWIKNNKSEVLKIEGERRQQEIVRGELNKLEEDFESQREKFRQAEAEAFEAESRASLAESKRNKIEQDIKSLESEKESLNSEIKLLQQSKVKFFDEANSLNEELQLLQKQKIEQQSILDSIKETAKDLHRDVEELKERKAIVESKRNGIEEKIKELEIKKNPLIEEINSLHSQLIEKQVEINGERKAVEALKAELEALNEQKIKTETAIELAKERDRNKILDDISDLEDKKTNISASIDELVVTKKHHKEEIFHLKSELEDLKNQKNEYINILSKDREKHKQLENSILKLNIENENLNNRLTDIQYKLKELINKKEPLAEEISSLKSTLEKCRAEATVEQKNLSSLKNTVDALNIQKQLLLKDIENSSNLGEEGTDSSKFASLFEEKPECLTSSDFKYRNTWDTKDERKALRQFSDYLKGDGKYFSQRVINAFHTALKCQNINPITVLAGVSGTGKTLLPIKYADFMGIHKLVMPVQPRWDSPQDLFGFYNYMERKYKATELSRCLVRMDPYNFQNHNFNKDLHSHLLLVLLDEMNLARTEYYFSEFLSRLELRRTVDFNDIYSRNVSEIELDTGPGGNTYRVYVPNNILFVGTMNEDESTQTLSDKVLDRSNVIRFGKPNTNEIDEIAYNGNIERHWLKKDVWQQWHKDIKSCYSNDWFKDIDTWTTEINDGLDEIGRPFGFRVREAIYSYIANYPDVDVDEAYKFAFADQIEQKILPKLRGIDMNAKGVSQTLSKLCVVIERLKDKELTTAYKKAVDESADIGMFHWRGVTRSATGE